jgi:hypothetical protein
MWLKQSMLETRLLAKFGESQGIQVTPSVTQPLLQRPHCWNLGG